MQQLSSHLYFQQAQIFFGSFQQDLMEENEADLDLNLIFDAACQPQNQTGLFFHWSDP